MPGLSAHRAQRVVSSALYLALCACTVGSYVLGVPADLRPVGVALLGFLILELRAAERLIAGSAAGLILLALLVEGAAPLALLVEAAVRTLPFLVLFLAVLCLQGPALASPSLGAIGGFVAQQPPGRRFAGIAAVGHVLGAVLSMAGLLLVLSLRDSRLPPGEQLRLTAGAMRGFAAAALWSPLFVAMSAVLAVLPELRWLEIAWRSLIAAAAIVALAWLWNRIGYGADARCEAAREGPASPLPGATLVHLGIIFCSLFLPVIVLFEAYDLSIPIALGLVAPTVAGVWQAAQGPAPGRLAGLARRGATVFGALPGLRNEALMFFAANTFGLGLSAALEAATLSGLADMLPAPGTAIPVLVIGGLVLAGLGVHPIVVVVAVGHALRPDVLRLSDSTVALCLLTVWGLGAIMSPFSATVLQVARLTNCSPFVVAWRWNARFCLAIALPMSAVVYLIARLL